MYSVIVPLNHSIYLLYQSFSRVRRTLTIITRKTIKNDPFIGYSETSDLIISGPLIETRERDPFNVLHHHSLHFKRQFYK